VEELLKQRALAHARRPKDGHEPPLAYRLLQLLKDMRTPDQRRLRSQHRRVFN